MWAVVDKKTKEIQFSRFHKSTTLRSMIYKEKDTAKRAMTHKPGMKDRCEVAEITNIELRFEQRTDENE